MNGYYNVYHSLQYRASETPAITSELIMILFTMTMETNTISCRYHSNIKGRYHYHDDSGYFTMVTIATFSTILDRDLGVTIAT